MKNPGGSIIHVIYDILKRLNKVNSCFSSEKIVREYNKRKKYRYIEKIIRVFRRRGRGKYLKTLEDKKLLKKWLNKHTNFKPVFWFKKCKKKNLFKLMKKSIKRLEHEREKKGLE